MAAERRFTWATIWSLDASDESKSLDFAASSFTASILTASSFLADSSLTSLSEKFEATDAITSASEVNWVRTVFTSSCAFSVSIFAVFSLSVSFLSVWSLAGFSFSALTVTSFSATGFASVLASSFTSGFSSAFTASIFNSGSSSTTGVDKVELERFLSEFDCSEVAGFTATVSSACTPLAPKTRAVPNRTLAAPKLYLRIEKRWALLPWYFSILEYMFSPYLYIC